LAFSVALVAADIVSQFAPRHQRAIFFGLAGGTAAFAAVVLSFVSATWLSERHRGDVDGAGGVRLAAALAPDLVVSDLHLGGSNGIELAQELGRTAPSVRVLILASNVSEAIVHQALAAGVVGCVLKGETGPAVVAAIHCVGRGELVLPPGVSVPRRRATGAIEGTGPDELVRLSQRERQIFDLVV
jgi:DNA-binding NarL/FixJ family response regulator